MSSNSFVDWIIEKEKERGWEDSQLAAQAGLSPSIVSMVISSRERKPGVKFCRGIARAFKLPPEIVFRKAGILPELPDFENDPISAEIGAFVQRLSLARKKQVLDFVRFVYQASEADKKVATDQEARLLAAVEKMTVQERENAIRYLLELARAELTGPPVGNSKKLPLRTEQ
jgi:transcriptional regulator with XRE-family HTH domain